MTRPQPRVRRAGSKWRLLVHQWLGKGEAYGTAHDLRNYPQDVIRPLEMDDAEYADYQAKVQQRRDESKAKGWSKDHDLSGTEFDELVVGQWLHVEQMDTGFWWMNIGGVTVHVRADRDGRPKHVMVHGPEDYASPVDGCEYELCWREDRAS
jgi:hypothetical protein